MPVSEIVDAHHHFWDPSRADYPWMTDELDVIRRPFGPDDLRPELEAHGVARTVLVQARSDEDETREFLEIARATGFVAGVVGWTDLTAPDVADRLAALMAAPGGQHLVGIRHQVHDEPDPEWLVRPDVLRGLAALAEAGLAFDLLVRTRELPAAAEAARRFPDLRFVLDHAGKPPIAAGELDAWRDGLRALGAHANVACKLSGMVTEADWQSWTPGDLAPVVATTLDVFGPQRLLFGSDWPVCLLAASYGDVVRALEEALPALGAGERDAIFGANAVDAYRLRS